MESVELPNVLDGRYCEHAARGAIEAEYSSL